jgi:hypothetical protein
MSYYSYNTFILVLHPRHKLDYFEKADWEEEWIVTAKRIVREEFERSYMAPVIEDQPLRSPSVCFVVVFLLFYLIFKFNSGINPKLETIQYIL